MMMISAILSMAIAAAAPAATEGETLRSAEELNDFADDPRRRYTPFCITGTVQAVDEPSSRYLVISDESGWVDIQNSTDHTPAPGERVALSGLAHMSTHQEIDIAADRIESLGTDTVAPPLVLPLRDISEEQHHLRTVVTEGTVIDAHFNSTFQLNFISKLAAFR